VDEWLKSTVC